MHSRLQVFRDRHGLMGIVDYASKDDMKYALRKLDDTEFKVSFESCLTPRTSARRQQLALPCCKHSLRGS